MTTTSELTTREREVAELMEQGLDSPSEIGRRIGLTKQRAHQLMKAVAKKGAEHG